MDGNMTVYIYIYSLGCLHYYSSKKHLKIYFISLNPSNNVVNSLLFFHNLKQIYFLFSPSLNYTFFSFLKLPN